MCIFLIACVIIFGAILWWSAVKKVEGYKDPLWMQRAKFYRDYYPRTNGSIYGTPRGGWNMFSGLNSNERVY